MAVIFFIANLFLLLSVIIEGNKDRNHRWSNSLVYIYLEIFNPVIYAKSAIIIAIVLSWELFTVFAK